jgi:hypothetical protein
MGDFSMLNDIPEIYRHCKATEDKVNIDGLFDKHPSGDEQKPHQPIQNQHHGQTTFSFISYCAIYITPFCPTDEVKRIMSVDNFLTSKYISQIFRPPIFT